VNAEYRAREWFWRFYRAAYRGGADWYQPEIDGNYLAQPRAVVTAGGLGPLSLAPGSNRPPSFLLAFEKESPADFLERRAHSYYPGYPAAVVDTYTAHLLVKDPSREGPPAYTEWVRDPMGTGASSERSMRTFMRRAVTIAQVYGHCIAVTDAADVGATPILTEADRAASVGAPYTYLLSPLDMPDWATDARGALLWARVREERADEPTACHRVWTREETWVERGSAGDAVEVSGTRRAHALGKVPIDILYSSRDSEGGFCGLSRIRDIAFVAREIYNLISQRQMVLYHNTFPWILIPDATNALSGEIMIGNRQAIPYDPGRGGAPTTLAPSLDGARLLGEVIQELVLEIRGLAGLSRGRGEQSVAARSADALLVETQDKGAMLRELAAQCEEFEMGLADTVMRWSGSDAGAVRVVYPTSFNVFALADDLDEALKIRQLGPPDAAWRAVVEGIMRRRLADLPAERVDEMLAELRSAPQTERPTLALAPTNGTPEAPPPDATA
jgi:hypothetical protein